MTLPLGKLPLGGRGLVAAILPSASLLENRLIEMGLVEGAPLELVHEGPFGRDPIVVQVHGTRIAMGRREAASILVEMPD